jgi:hypothetical protein
VGKQEPAANPRYGSSASRSGSRVVRAGTLTVKGMAEKDHSKTVRTNLFKAVDKSALGLSLIATVELLTAWKGLNDHAESN